MPNDIILPEKEHVGLSILLVAGGVDDEVEAAKCLCNFLEWLSENLIESPNVSFSSSVASNQGTKNTCNQLLIYGGAVMATFLIVANALPIHLMYLPVLAPEYEREEQPDVGDVVAVVAADELDGVNGERAEEVAQADRADHLGHPLVARR